MIDGLRIKVGHEELADHLRERADYHRKRAADKTAKLPKLKEAMEELKAANNTTGQSAGQMSKFSNAIYSSDPDSVVEKLEQDIKYHKNTALVFDYFASHLFPDVYNLAEADLKRLQILRD